MADKIIKIYPDLRGRRGPLTQIERKPQSSWHRNQRSGVYFSSANFSVVVDAGRRLVCLQRDQKKGTAAFRAGRLISG